MYTMGHPAYCILLYGKFNWSEKGYCIWPDNDMLIYVFKIFRETNSQKSADLLLNPVLYSEMICMRTYCIIHARVVLKMEKKF